MLFVRNLTPPKHTRFVDFIHAWGPPLCWNRQKPSQAHGIETYIHNFIRAYMKKERIYVCMFEAYIHTRSVATESPKTITGRRVLNLYRRFKAQTRSWVALSWLSTNRKKPHREKGFGLLSNIHENTHDDSSIGVAFSLIFYNLT